MEVWGGVVVWGLKLRWRCGGVGFGGVGKV